MALTYFSGGGCAIYLVGKNPFRYVPETANVPEDGATLHAQNGPNCAIYPISNLNPFFRDWTCRSSKPSKTRGVCVQRKFCGKGFFPYSKDGATTSRKVGQSHALSPRRKHGDMEDGSLCFAHIASTVQ